MQFLKIRDSSQSGCIKAKNGQTLLDKDESRWSEYIGELFDDSRGSKPVIWRNMEGPKILEAVSGSSNEKNEE